jgi:hypothetical protein
MDQIKAISNLVFVNTYLKAVSFLLALLLLVSLGANMVLVVRQHEVRGETIFVNTETGNATIIDADLIDPSGEKRHEVEIQAFINDFLSNLYTFNKYTIKSNLENGLAVVAGSAANSVRLYWQTGTRADDVAAGYQGLCEISNVFILNGLPDLRVQIYFSKKLIGEGGTVRTDSRFAAVMRIRTVLRDRKNPHGFLIVEYREDPVNPSSTAEKGK